MYNVFTDFHHASLLQSLILLFEKRLGGRVFRPIGMEWATEGFWKVYDHPATQLQYLTLDQGFRPVDGTPQLNQIKEFVSADQLLNREGIYFCQDIDSGSFNKAMTLSAFFQMPIDIVIASLPQHIEPFKRLAEQHPNKPKFIYQIGNQWDIDPFQVKNVMASANVHIPFGVTGIIYHQEFDISIFTPMYKFIADAEGLVTPAKNIYSFVNVFQDFKEEYALFESIERMLPGYSFKSFGGQCRDGAAHGSRDLADKMNHARFIWHVKPGGDGYGHVLHNAAAVGKPMIVKKSYYSGKLGDRLLIDGQTCINIDNLSREEIVYKINYYSEPAEYARMSENVYRNFQEVVDFNQEADRMELFLRSLQ